MSEDENKKPVEKAAVAAPEPTEENRIDPFAISQFRAMGYEGRLPDTLVAVYREYKERKDRLQPGRLSPEGLAFVDLWASVIDGFKLKVE